MTRARKEIAIRTSKHDVIEYLTSVEVERAELALVFKRAHTDSNEDDDADDEVEHEE